MTSNSSTHTVVLRTSPLCTMCMRARGALSALQCPRRARARATAQKDVHEEVEDQVQKGLLEPHALAERDDGLLEADREHGRAWREGEARPPLLEEEPRERAQHFSRPVRGARCEGRDARGGEV